MESFLAGVWPRPVRDDTAGRTEAKCVCVWVCVCVCGFNSVALFGGFARTVFG
jgi:hypothetical protein